MKLSTKINEAFFLGVLWMLSITILALILQTDWIAWLILSISSVATYSLLSRLKKEKK